MNKQRLPSDMMQPLRIPPRYQILKVLGRGGEGVVYLAADLASGRKSVVKLFHEPRTKRECQSLRIYAERVSGDHPGLPELTVLEDASGVQGIAYLHRRLHRVHYRLWGLSRHLAQAVVGCYCRMQAYLLSEVGTVLWDADVVNFLMASDGHFHWVDFGWGIQMIDHPWNRERGSVGYGLAMLLLSAHGINIKPSVLVSPGYSLAEPCRYCMDPRLDVLAAQRPWVREIVREVRQRPAAAFLEPELYRRLGAALPDRVMAPLAVILTSNALTMAGAVKSHLRRSNRGGRAAPEGTPAERH